MITNPDHRGDIMSVPENIAKRYKSYKDARARFGEWQFGSISYGGFAFAEMDDPPAGYELRVIIGDDDQPTDWGDIEPTEEEREAASSYYVAVVVVDPETAEELHHDGIGGVDVIDLPGYLQRDWEDAAGYALVEYLLDDAEKFALNEATERDHWAARDTITI